MDYRPEIDGLRAIAVLSVILFHAGLTAIPGGHLGVDIFFVISGYLITSIIAKEMEDGRFEFAAFYERRARRILPALIVVLLACIPFVLIFMLPREVTEFSKSVIAVCVFASNVFFWAQSGYFDRAAELKPLLHTWSLGVEEQFYLVFPILLMGALRFGRRRAGMLFAAIAVASIAYAQWGPQTREDTFYLIPSRLWELLAGALLALWPVTKLRAELPNAALDMFVIVGIGSIGYGLLDHGEIRYPDLGALPAVLGAGLIIAFASTRTITGRLLGSRVPVAIGLISYGAYLWHQPVLVFARLSGFQRPSIGTALALTAFSLVLAFLTYRFVEQPARNRKRLGRPALIVLTSLGMSFLSGASIFAIATNGFEKQGLYFSNNDTRRLYELLERNTGGDFMRDMGSDGDCMFWTSQLQPAEWSRFIDCSKRFGPATVVLGDSHAMNIYNALFRNNYAKFLVGLVGPGCRPWARIPECPYLSFDKFMEAHRDTVETVILHFSGSHLVVDEHNRQEPEDVLRFGGKYHFNERPIAKTIDYLQSLSKMTKTIWLGPFVEARMDFRDFESMKRVARGGFHLNPPTVDIFSALDEHLRDKIRLQRGHFRYISFFDVIDQDARGLVDGDCLMYRDSDHLSVCGERIVGKDLKALLLRGTSSER
ncbi:acyltransferase family protein [Bradyrhizobium sp. DOA9]|uniref:acyltransferase family protein n=1 Tax=Bradyrhizobium sp. DOA9 TaxID=1126627 RepID=UPI0004694FD0|nr:acyltransferase family protein [Bradyrhizobium sp. DOA9]GAJ36598.1 putative membrane-bound transacylase bcsY [Bradyrhizobium sp. DOA9]